MRKVSMLTVVPQKMALDLVNNKVLKDFNTLPKVNKILLDTVKSYMKDNVGYENLPIACLSISKNSGGGIADIVQQYLPVNSKDSILFQLDMPEDMIVAMEYAKMLEYSAELDSTTDPEMTNFVKEDILDSLKVGFPTTEQNYIFFIPFLAVDKCNFYAKFDSTFTAEELNLPGIEKMTLTELSAFYS